MSKDNESQIRSRRSFFDAPQNAMVEFDIMFHVGIEVTILHCRSHGIQFTTEFAGVAFQCWRSGTSTDLLKCSSNLVGFLHLFGSGRANYY